MKVNSVIWIEAMNLRGFIASEFLKYHGPTDAEAGKTLTIIARERGYSERAKPVLGRTLRDWQEGSAPQWAVKSMVDYILMKGFIPESNLVLDVFIAYMLVGADTTDSLLSNKLLSNIDVSEIELSVNRVLT